MPPPQVIGVPRGVAVPSLVRWGLPVDADLVFRALATLGPRTEHALAVELGLSRQRVADAVADLRAAGAADDRAGGRSTPVWHTRPPADVIAGLRARRMRLVDPGAQADRHHGLVRLLTDRLGSAGIAVAPASLGGTLGDHVRFYPNRRLARARQTELGQAQRFDRLVINTEQSFEPAVAAVALPNMRRMVERDIRFRILGPPPVDGDLYRPGEEFVNDTTYRYREAPRMPLKVIVMDRRTAFFPIDALDHDRGFLEVDHPVVVGVLIDVFERHWAEATDPRRYGVPRIQLSDRERRLVDLLAEGHTDVTAAEQLRISARSISYMIRSLMDRVGVENRFQLGLALGTMRAAAPPPLTDPAAPGRSALLR
jgi:DNA-binding CsgD family transcriptional regulator